MATESNAAVQAAGRSAGAGEVLLELTGVAVRYGAVHALREATLAVRAGEVVTLIGANGAGKTTTLRSITGLAQLTAGDVLYDGRSIRSVPAHRRVALGIAMAPEGRGVFATLSVRENLEMGGYLVRDPKRREAGIERAYRLFPRLAERAKQKAGTLSGGEQQMLAIGRALMCDPRLLLLDEPSLGLAPLVVHTIFEAIDEVRAAGTTILLVEQNAHAALRHSDRAYVLEQGRIVMSGPSAELAADPRIREAYLGD